MADTADRVTIPDLLRFLYRETAGARLKIIIPSVISGLARGGLLAAFNEAATRAGRTGLDAGLVGIFAGCLLLYLVSTYASAIASDRLVRHLLHRLRLSISEKLIHAPLRLVEAQDPGKIFTLIGHESENLANVAKDFILTFQAAIVLAFAMAYLVWLSVPSFLLTLVVIIGGAATYYWNDRKAKDRYRLAREKEVEYFDTMYDLLHGFKDLKLGKAQQDEIMAHLRRVSEEFRSLAHASTRLYQVSELVSQGFTFLLIALIVFVIPMLFPGGPISVYQLLATVLYLLAPVEQMISSVPSFSRGAVALANIDRLERAVGQQSSLTPPVSALPASFETISLRQVHFEFRSENKSENFDLGPIDLEIRRGESLFICGGNGAGKTTLLKVIAGLYHPTAGTMLVDGEEITGSNSADYREFFAVIFNEPYLMKRLYGLQDFDTELEKVLLAELELEHKTALSDGRFTTTRLSAGQRKRLSYAISRLRDRQIYIFDEFAADQDPQFRAYFYTTLLPTLKRQGKTIIAITHDDRWFSAGDRLLKLEYGKIVPVES